MACVKTKGANKKGLRKQHAISVSNCLSKGQTHVYCSCIIEGLDVRVETNIYKYKLLLTQGQKTPHPQLVGSPSTFKKKIIIFFYFFIFLKKRMKQFPPTNSIILDVTTPRQPKLIFIPSPTSYFTKFLAISLSSMIFLQLHVQF